MAANAFYRADCAQYRAGAPGEGDCETDGHWLCVGCSQMAPSQLHRREVCKGEPDCEECHEEAQERRSAKARQEADRARRVRVLELELAVLQEGR